MGSTRITVTELEAGLQPRGPAVPGARPVCADRHCLDGRRAGLAGGIWLLLLYSLCVALFLGLGHTPRTGMSGLWASFLPGFDGGSIRGILLGFPVAFLYGAGGAWLFAMIYNVLPGWVRTPTEAS